MKFTLSWLKEHLDTDASVDEISETLTRIGLEVEEVVNPAANLSDFITAKIEKVEKHETKVDKMQDQMREGHIQRLIDKKCQVEAGIIFLDSVSDYERISDHAENLAKYVVEEEEKF